MTELTVFRRSMTLLMAGATLLAAGLMCAAEKPHPSDSDYKDVQSKLAKSRTERSAALG